MDCLTIINKFTDSGIHLVPVKYLYESMNKLLTTPDNNEPQNKDYDSPKNITGIMDDFEFLERLTEL